MDMGHYLTWNQLRQHLNKLPPGAGSKFCDGGGGDNYNTQGDAF